MTYLKMIAVLPLVLFLTLLSVPHVFIALAFGAGLGDHERHDWWIEHSPMWWWMTRRDAA